ncbi:tyrosine-type DNA invertase [Citrobacter braakii]|uniref:tyrosine-type DNA invertase n=1 Tax=Citrobacter braakii TaxID=57706 RepID=UPI00351CEFBA
MKKRKHLTREEIYSLLEAARKGRHGLRNHCLIYLAWRHGFRISELLLLKVSDIDLSARNIFIRRLKNGFSTIHPFDEKEFLVISTWLAERSNYISAVRSELLFLSERSPSLSRKQAWHIVKKSGYISGVSVQTHPHMLRHACGYALANMGADTRLIQDYLGHRNIRHTVRYTMGAASRFIKLMEAMEG